VWALELVRASGVPGPAELWKDWGGRTAHNGDRCSDRLVPTSGQIHAAMILTSSACAGWPLACTDARGFKLSAL
jgi:hypothetical protein